MSRLVDQMVEVARLEEGSLRLRADRVDLCAIADEAVGLVRALEEPPAHSIVFEPFPGELNVLGDPERIQMILSNLLSNANKYSPSGPVETTTREQTAALGRVPL